MPFGMLNTRNGAAPWPGETYGAPSRSSTELIAKWDALAKSGPDDRDVRDAAIPRVITIKAETLDELAEKLALPAATLKATITRYNGFCQEGIDEDFGKRRSLLIPVDEGPFYGVIPCLHR